MGVTLEERTEGRDLWNELWSAWQLYQFRSAWLYDHQEHEEWEGRDEETRIQGLRVGTLRDALASWCAASPVVVSELLGEVTDDETQTPAAS